MNNEAIVYSRRDSFRKSVLSNLRANGFIPAVLYGADNDCIPGYVSRKEFEPVFKKKGLAGKVTIIIDNQKKSAIIKDIQKHLTNHQIIHADFQILSENKPIYVEIPIIFEKIDILRSKGLILQRQLDTVEIEGLPQNIPEHLVIDVSKYSKPYTIKITDIELPNGVKVLEDRDEIIAIIDTTDTEEETKNE